MSLAELSKKYQASKRNREKTCQSLRLQIEKSIEDTTISALKLQNHKVNQIHKNQQAIESKLKKQQELLTQFRGHQDAWTTLYEQLNRALMNAGDLSHYAGYVEAQIKQILGEGTVAQFLQLSQRQNEQQDTNKQQHIEIPITGKQVEIEMKVQSESALENKQIPLTGQKS